MKINNKIARAIWFKMQIRKHLKYIYKVTIESKKYFDFQKWYFPGNPTSLYINSFVNFNKSLPEDFLFLSENLVGASKMRILTFVFVLLTLYKPWGSYNYWVIKQIVNWGYLRTEYSVMKVGIRIGCFSFVSLY